MAYVLFAFVVLIGIIWGCIAVLGLRTFVGLVVLLGIGLIIYANIANENDRKQKEANGIETAATERREASLQSELWSKVRPSQIELRDPTLTAPQFGIGDYGLTATIKNLSNQQLSGFEIKVTASDCLAPGKCEIVGGDTKTVWADIPPQQVRGVTGRVTLLNMPQLRGKLTPSFKVTRVYAGDFLDQWGVHEKK